MLFNWLNYVFFYKWMTLLTLSFGQGEEKYENATVNITPSPYPFTYKYFKEVKKSEIQCIGFVCENSGLNIIVIDLLLNHFNNALMRYAERNQLSNIYRLHWSNELANLAKDKARRCLPSTYEGLQKKYLFYDNQSLFELAYFNPTLKIKDAVVEVVSGLRNKTYGDTEVRNDLIFKTEMVADYTKLFFSNDEDFEARASCTMMGCAYIYNEINQTSFDHLLCIFGLIYLGNKTFEKKRGKVCSNCTYYEQIKMNPSLKVTDRVPAWGCDMNFPTLCADINRLFEEIDTEASLYDCSTFVKTPKTAMPTPFSPFAALKQRFRVWPCWSILIPLLILIFIFLSLCLFHTITALKLRQLRK